MKKLLKSKSIYLLNLYRSLRLRRLQLLKPQKTVHGFNFIGPQNTINGSFEENEFNCINAFISNCDLFINIGANYGYYVCLALSHDKKVYAFEPDLNNYQILSKNVILNDGMKNALLFNFGVGNTWDYIKIFNAATGSSFIKGWANNSASFYNQAQICTIDDFSYNGSNLFFLIDVEGFENFVVKGGLKTIQRVVNQTWVIEMMLNDEHGTFDEMEQWHLEIVDIFQSNGFNFACILNGNKHNLTYENFKRIIKNKDTSFGYNFIFFKNV